jgi:hypothetical protein
MTTKKIGIHAIYKDNKIIAFFTRDEESNKNVIYMAEEAGLDEIESLFNSKEEKI